MRVLVSVGIEGTGLSVCIEKGGAHLVLHWKLKYYAKFNKLLGNRTRNQLNKGIEKYIRHYQIAFW